MVNINNPKQKQHKKNNKMKIGCDRKDCNINNVEIPDDEAFPNIAGTAIFLITFNKLYAGKQ
jgi:hypothetical protein